MSNAIVSLAVEEIAALRSALLAMTRTIPAGTEIPS